MRVLELFFGIGGAAAGLSPEDVVVAAVDHDVQALATYGAWLPHRRITRNLETVTPGWLAGFDADLWWLSPPCQPYGIRGRQLDLADPRARPLLNVIRAIHEVRPRFVAMENVPWFAGSGAWRLLREALADHAVDEREICTSHLGYPVERRRWYLIAARDRPVHIPPPNQRLILPIRGFLDEAAGVGLEIPEERLDRYKAAFHVVDPDEPGAVAACFTAAYGRSPVYCGSYLRDRGALRHLAPEEIARLHGFPREFRFAADLTLRRRWTQAGHAVPPPAVRHALTGLGQSVNGPTTPYQIMM